MRKLPLAAVLSVWPHLEPFHEAAMWLLWVRGHSEALSYSTGCLSVPMKSPEGERRAPISLALLWSLSPVAHLIHMLIFTAVTSW